MRWFVGMDVNRLVSAANSGDPEAARQLHARFRTGETLAVYGTLAPGQPNHHIVAPLGGEWSRGFVEGELLPIGWGAGVGYPGFRPRGGGASVPVHVLIAPALASAWPMLDEFEGTDYRRILVPVFNAEGGLYTVANLYAAALT